MPEALEPALQNNDDVRRTAEMQMAAAVDPAKWEKQGGLVLTSDELITALKSLDPQNMRHLAAAHAGVDRYWRELGQWAIRNDGDQEAAAWALKRMRVSFEEMFNSQSGMEAGQLGSLTEMIEMMKDLQQCFVIARASIP